MRARWTEWTQWTRCGACRRPDESGCRRGVVRAGAASIGSSRSIVSTVSTVSTILALFAGGCLQSPGGQGAAEAPALEVRVATAEERPVPDGVRVVGSFLANERVVLSTEVPGTVVELPVDFGDRVRKGDVVARLDPREPALRLEAARAALAQAQAVLDRAHSNHQRAQHLYRQKILSKELLDGVVSEWRVAAANHEAAAKQLALAEKHATDTTIRSPLDGFVVVRHSAVGQYVAPAAPLIELVSTDPLKLQLDLPERVLGQVRAGQPVQVETEAFPGRTFAGTVTRVGSVLDPNTRMLPIQCFVPNPDGQLKPGQFAAATIDLGTRSAVLVPRAAVDSFAGTHRAFVVGADGSVVARAVTLGRDLGTQIAITAGVRPGEVVAVSHLERLADGMRVRPLAETQRADAGS